MGKLYLENYWNNIHPCTPHNFVNGLHFVALTRLRATKTRSKLPRSHFLQKKALGPLYISIIWPFMAHPNISLPFRVTGQRVKKFCFSLISLSVRKKKLRACLCSILMPPTFHIANLNRYTPKFTRVVSFRWHPAPSKVSISEKLSIIFGVFQGIFWTK